MKQAKESFIQVIAAVVVAVLVAVVVIRYREAVVGLLSLLGLGVLIHKTADYWRRR